MVFEFGCTEMMTTCLGGCLVAGYSFIPVTMGAVGLSGVGPAAGGFFAGAQAAGAVTAGSWWATAQSLAMGGMSGIATGISTATIFACVSACPFTTGCSMEDFCKAEARHYYYIPLDSIQSHLCQNENDPNFSSN